MQSNIKDEQALSQFQIVSSHQKKDVTDYSVALLFDDIAEAKIISDSLRELGIYAHFYDELDKFWVAANAKTPDLTLVDLKKMTMGKLKFKDHPKVKENKLCYAFLYKNDTKALLSSASRLNHYGLINYEVNLVDQLVSLLARRNAEQKLLEHTKQQEKRIAHLQKRNQEVFQDVEVSYNFEKQYSALKQLVSRFGSSHSEVSFTKRVMNVLSSWDQCEVFGIYQLNETSQKLISPTLQQNKYQQLPALWLNSENLRGIEDYAINMAEEVAFDLFNKSIQVIRISGKYERPDMIVLGAFAEDELIDFQWDALERELTSLHRESLIRNLDSERTKTAEVDIWSAASFMDDMYFHQSQADFKILSIDFSKLIQAIKTHSNNRFQWKAFYSDLNYQLKKSLTGQFQLSHYGLEKIIIFVEAKQVDVNMNSAKDVIKEINFWRYFEDSSILISQDIEAEVDLMAASSVNMIRQIHKRVKSENSRLTQSGSHKKGFFTSPSNSLDI